MTEGGPIMVPLPDGQHALLRQPRTVPERLRRPLTHARTRLSALLPETPPGATEDEQKEIYGRALSLTPEVMSEVNDLMIMALVTDWSFGHPITLDGLIELPGEAYDALKAECEKYRDELFPDFSPNADKDSPTVRSSDSEA